MPTNWMTVTESRYPWERDALDFVRERFPEHEPYRAWSNFEFIADDGSINEVDLLVCSPQGFFLIEIKSHTGRLSGDAGTWTWERNGRLSTMDNPVMLANTKAKKLRALLQRQKASRKRGALPFLEALVFCSGEDVRCELQGTARYRICLRDLEPQRHGTARPGIMAAIKRRDCPGLDATPRGVCDRPTTRAISQAMEQAGIRPSQRHRKVSDYELQELIGEGPGYQDWQATHTRLTGVRRRVRIYTVRTGASIEERRTIERAADREAQLLETLQHPGILRREGFTEHELGPALIFEHDPGAVRLDHFMRQRRHQLGIDGQLALLRQIADVMRFAHDKKVVHRALSPLSILVMEPEAAQPHIKIFNWQTGFRQGNSSSTSGVTREIAATSHAERLVDDVSTAYMAPESFVASDDAGEHLDVFSLGAIAYYLFSGQPPADNGLALSNKLRETKGLQITSVLDGAGEHLQFLVQFSTHPEVANRIDSVTDFLDYLDEVENELTTPDHEVVDNPVLAQQGDLLPGNLKVLKRLGQGSCSVALLVERDGEPYVLKVASDPDHNARLKDEGDVLQKLWHQHIVKYDSTLEMGDRTCVLMHRAGQETLGQKLRKEGRLHVDLLQRFGADLLGVVAYLEEQGIPHRDIKPDNIGVGPVGRGSTLHLVLFDFSLSRTPPDNLRAGTAGYLEPLLPLRQPPRWDLHAERYAAAITLYELAAGPHTLPRWGDGTSDPSHLDCEVTIEADLFEVGLREPLAGFFARALRRDPAERFDNADEMLWAWRHCFEGIEQPGAFADPHDEAKLRELLAEATLDTPIPELGLGTRMINALDRANLLTVEDLLAVPLRRLMRLRGVGHKTRLEIVSAVKMLRDRLGNTMPPETMAEAEASDAPMDPGDAGSLSIDLLVQRLMRGGAREGEVAERTRQALLGLAPDVQEWWPSQVGLALYTNVSRGRVGQLVGKLQQRWAKEPAITRLRADIAEMLPAAGGVMTVHELSQAVLMARGSIEDEPQRSRLAMAAARAAVEVERSMDRPRFSVRRDHGRVLIASHADLASYASRLGQCADQLADEDPLASPARVLEKLGKLAPPPAASPLSDTRLVRLAAAASGHAALSSRQELYPTGMEAARALRLSQGALLGGAPLNVEQVRERVHSRYPEAAPLPDRPALDDLLRAVGFDVAWDPAANHGRGAYVSRLYDTAPISSATDAASRHTTGSGSAPTDMSTPETADARQFEERLQRSIKDGAFLALLVAPHHYHRALDELSRRFPVEVIDLEALCLDALRQVAEQARVNWELVLKTDATPHQGDWNKLMLLVGRAMPLVEARLSTATRPLLLIYPGLLARYDRMDLLQRLRDRIGQRDGIPGLWLLLPGQHQALIDGKAVPMLSPGQRAVIPEGWLRNTHRR